MASPLRSVWNRTWVCASKRLVLHLDTGIPYQRAYLWMLHHGTKYNARVRELPKAPIVLKPVLPLIPNSYRGGAQGVLRFDYDDVVEKGGNSFDVSYTVGNIIETSPTGASEDASPRLYLSRTPLPNVSSLPPIEFHPMMMRFEFHP